MHTFIMRPEGRANTVVAALSNRPLHFCLEHISKSIEGNLMKLVIIVLFGGGRNFL